MSAWIIAFQLLWKRKWANLLLLLQILLSIITLAQSFVFISDHIDHVRAVNELPVENAAVLHVFDYESPEDIATRLSEEPLLDDVGTVLFHSIFYQNRSCSLAVYNDAWIARYTPSLQSGVWFSDASNVADDAIPVVVSSDFGFSIGSVVDVPIDRGHSCHLQVIGILSSPTQYLFPTGGASPSYFSASSIISNSPVFIFEQSSLAKDAFFDRWDGLQMTKNLFLFFQPDISDESRQAVIDKWNQYGELTMFSSLISTYTKDTSKLIRSGVLTFVVFFLLAFASVLSNQVIQSLRNRNRMLIYYLSGMSWRDAVLAEGYRILILILVTCGLVFLLGQTGVLMLN